MQIRCNFPDISYLSETQKNNFQFLSKRYEFVLPVWQLRWNRKCIYWFDTIHFFLQGEKRVGPPTKDAFELHCLRVVNEYWLNANNAQMDVGTAHVDWNL